MPISLTSIDFWADQEQRIHALIGDALSMLALESPLPLEEDLLNRRLAQLLDQVDCAARVRGVGPMCLVTYEGRIHPDQLERVRQTYEFKRPDFQWFLADDQAPIDRYRRAYTVECKRLGDTLPSGWVLNEQYVAGGILRFINDAYGPYSRHENSGAMIGYIQSSSHHSILSEVNQYAALHHISPLCSIGNPWPQSPFCALEHEVLRNAPPTSIRLAHFWADLRKLD